MKTTTFILRILGNSAAELHHFNAAPNLTPVRQNDAAPVQTSSYWRIYVVNTVIQKCIRLIRLRVKPEKNRWLLSAPDPSPVPPHWLSISERECIRPTTDDQLCIGQMIIYCISIANCVGPG
jgi:hypothetical protein